ncbi:hypothetical protein EUGRSUZ_L00980 [Eucalyptus grandis]|uniref:Uncharacterized protein n=1 Tax=Eucalyptus grandis TaxID=71139 RepID=A0A058ZU71_EUCGR|nr:hypothetical protein EUGRSUZ_L00980 [Eucalyptus grandis]KAK2632857.1 hypothetical protein EUGRSUZ_L00980 [Eucalyptus grandis]
MTIYQRGNSTLKLLCRRNAMIMLSMPQHNVCTPVGLSRDINTRGYDLVCNMWLLSLNYQFALTWLIWHWVVMLIVMWFRIFIRDIGWSLWIDKRIKAVVPSYALGLLSISTIF